jgi:uncharacterized alkaline shock family protein YloU
MRRMLHLILGLILTLTLAGLGGGLLYAAFYDQECWQSILTFLMEERGIGALGGIAILFVLVAFFLTGIQRDASTGEDVLTFKNNGGTVSISLRAVNEFIAKIADEFAALLSLKPSVTPKGTGVVIDLDIRVKAGTQIPELCQLLQDRVKESVRQNMGISEIRRIQVHVKDIVGTVPPSDPTVDIEEQSV